MDSLELANKIRSLIDEKLGEEIVVLDLRTVSSVTDFLIIATARADTHVRSICDYVTVELKKENIAPMGAEGLNSNWACLDYVDVIAHIMRGAEREMYNLEAIWGGSKRV